MKHRKKFIKVRVTEEEADRWKNKAAAAGLSVSDLIRQRLDEIQIECHQRKSKKVVHLADPDLIREIAKIGNNLNQVARYIHSVSKLEVVAIKALISIERELKGLINVE